MGLEMSRNFALLLVLIILTATCLVIAKPALSADDLTENSWVTKASMNTARAYPGVASVNGKIYVIGGDTGSITAQGVNAEFFSQERSLTLPKSIILLRMGGLSRHPCQLLGRVLV
jgi:hypothetical protein